MQIIILILCLNLDVSHTSNLTSAPSDKKLLKFLEKLTTAIYLQ